MANDRPDPGEFLEMAQRMLRQLFDTSGGSEEPWAGATRQGGASARERHREVSPEERRENLTFALATRAVEALEDVALNVAAIRQRLERTAPAAAEGPRTAPAEDARPAAEGPRAGGDEPPPAGG
jgi:hypothetical protein